jgi:hypothetical protein
VGLIIGNGLSIDLHQSNEALGTWNPSSPLGWDLRAPNHPDEHLLNYLPRFREQVQAIRAEHHDLTDFDVFEAIAAKFIGQDGFDACVTVAEMRHFLALAYSAFQLEVDKLNLGDWRWTLFLRSLRSRLRAVVSFNYELVLERLLAHSGVVFGRVGIDTNYQVMLLKPHGSIDSALHPKIIQAPVGYPLANCIDRNDAPIARLVPGQWLQPRLEVDIVLPMEQSPYLPFQWVRPGYEMFARLGDKLDCLVLAGLSYWGVDRPEINYLLDCLSPRSRIVVVNPHPDPELMARLASFETVRQIAEPTALDAIFD